MYTYEDGGVLHGTYADGELNGPAQEFDPEGRLIFKGQYRDNIRCGICWIYYPVCFREEVVLASGRSDCYSYNETVVAHRTEAVWWARSMRTGR